MSIVPSIGPSFPRAHIPKCVNNVSCGKAPFLLLFSHGATCVMFPMVDTAHRPLVSSVDFTEDPAWRQKCSQIPPRASVLPSKILFPHSRLRLCLLPFPAVYFPFPTSSPLKCPHCLSNSALALCYMFTQQNNNLIVSQKPYNIFFLPANPSGNLNHSLNNRSLLGTGLGGKLLNKINVCHKNSFR